MPKRKYNKKIKNKNTNNNKNNNTIHIHLNNKNNLYIINNMLKKKLYKYHKLKHLHHYIK